MKKLVSIKQSALILNLSTQATRKLFTSKKLETARKVENIWVASREEIEALKIERASNKVEIDDSYVDIKTISTLTTYNEQYVRKLMVAGRWNSTKLNGKWLAKRVDVENDLDKKNESTAPDDYVNLSEFAAKCNYNIHYVRKLARENKIESIKVNNVYYVHEDTLAARIEKISIRAQLRELNA